MKVFMSKWCPFNWSIVHVRVTIIISTVKENTQNQLICVYFTISLFLAAVCKHSCIQSVFSRQSNPHSNRGIIQPSDTLSLEILSRHTSSVFFSSSSRCKYTCTYIYRSTYLFILKFVSEWNPHLHVSLQLKHQADTKQQEGRLKGSLHVDIKCVSKFRRHAGQV